MVAIDISPTDGATISCESLESRRSPDPNPWIRVPELSLLEFHLSFGDI